MPSPRRPAVSRLGALPKLLALLVVLGFLGGCVRGCSTSRTPIHLNPNMDDQPRYDAQESSAFFRDGSAMRPAVVGTIARGELPLDEVFATGKSFWSGYAATPPIDVDAKTLRRGHGRYEIYCTPCHGAAGDGQSALARVAGVQSADLLDDRIQAMPAGELFEVITKGRGLMPGYDFPLSPEDRWAIVAWVLQLGADPRVAGRALAATEENGE